MIVSEEINYEDELLTILVVSRVLNIEEENCIKKILLKNKIKPDVIRNNHGAKCSYYKVKSFLIKNVVDEILLINKHLTNEKIINLLRGHINIVIEIRKKQENDILNVSIDPKKEVELIKHKIREQKITTKELDEKIKHEYNENKLKKREYKYSENVKYSEKIECDQLILEHNREKKKIQYEKVKLQMKQNRDLYINIRIKCNLRSRLYIALNSNKKIDETIKLIGCSITELKEYLKGKFKSGMNWDNYGKKSWHIDHIIPCDAFDFRVTEAQYFCFNYKNLQPLWTKENLTKNGTIDYEYLINIGVNPDILKFRYKKVLLELIDLKEQKTTKNSKKNE